MRAHGRAVAAADYEILALRATGAQVARANAVAAFHPAYPGTPIPGVVCVFVVPPERGSGPPTPDAETLRAVSTYLTNGVAPAGVEVVAELEVGCDRLHNSGFSRLNFDGKGTGSAHFRAAKERFPAAKSGRSVVFRRAPVGS